jgi:multiple sugar transport system substrate-binding protein
MSDLQLSVMFHDQEALDKLQGLLDAFKKRTRISVDLRVINWQNCWSELLQVALFREGPDVSEIGNTWVGDFARMVALRPFTSSEIDQLGGSDAYLPSSWNSGIIYEEPDVWAVPWLADTRILFFRRDILNEAGIEEETAFDTHDQLVHTLEKLQKHGVEIPWSIPTQQATMTLHHVASWIWGAGGHFFTPDGRSPLFSSTEALIGLEQYFSLGRFLSPAARHKNDTESDRLFWQHGAAATMSGPWMLSESIITDEVRSNIGFVSPPGIPFVGGSHLAIWKHTNHAKEAFELVKFLTSEETQDAYCKAIGLLPAKHKVFSMPTYASNLFYQRMVERLKTGRSFRTVPMWGMIENRWALALANIWTDIFENPDRDLKELIEKNIAPLNRRLNLTISQG